MSVKKTKSRTNDPLPVSVGEKHALHIESITQQGQGVGKIDGLTIFVDGGVPGDRLQIQITTVKKTYAVGKILEITESSKDRTLPLCPYFSDCGGCQFQYIKYSAQLKYKRQIVVDALQRIGSIKNADDLTRPVLGMNAPKRYRNKAQFKVSDNGIGFYARNSHRIVPIDDCLNQPESCTKVIQATRELINNGILTAYDEVKHRGLLRGVVQRSNRQGDEMLTLILSEKTPELYDSLIAFYREALPGLKSLNVNINPNQGNTIFGEETFCLLGDETLTEHLDGLQFELSPRAFFQVNTAQAEVLYRQVKKFAELDGSQVVNDLFCGTGTIGLYLSDRAKKVVGIEIIEEAVENARQNARRNNIDNAVFYCGKAEVLFDRAIQENGRPDLLVVDPPRKGMDASIIDLLSDINVPRVIYVSCNPATLARDLALMIQKGYVLQKVQPVDLFPHTGHVETVVLLCRK